MIQDSARAGRSRHEGHLLFLLLLSTRARSCEHGRPVSPVACALAADGGFGIDHVGGKPGADALRFPCVERSSQL